MHKTDIEKALYVQSHAWRMIIATQYLLCYWICPYPEGFRYRTMPDNGRSSGLSLRLFAFPESKIIPVAFEKQMPCAKSGRGITAAGTATASHGFPSSSFSTLRLKNFQFATSMLIPIWKQTLQATKTIVTAKLMTFYHFAKFSERIAVQKIFPKAIRDGGVMLSESW